MKPSYLRDNVGFLLCVRGQAAHRNPYFASCGRTRINSMACSISSAEHRCANKEVEAWIGKKAGSLEEVPGLAPAGGSPAAVHSLNENSSQT